MKSRNDMQAHIGIKCDEKIEMNVMAGMGKKSKNRKMKKNKIGRKK